MQSFTAIICLLAIACNAALAGVGSVAFCLEKGADSRLSFGCPQKPADPCCPSNPTDATDHPANCDICLDGKISASDQDDTTRKGDRSLLKTRLPLATLPAEDLPLRPRSLCPTPRHTERPTAVTTQAAQHFADTVALHL